MTQQIGTFTTGELGASIEGHGEFNAQNVEFMGSTNDPDFLLRGMDASRDLIFYFPRFESGHYVLGVGSANKAFYEVDGALNGEVKEGFVDVTVEAEDAVSVSFNFSIEDKAGTTFCITGSGYFKGRVPWTDNGRAVSNIVYGVDDPHIFNPAPRFYEPKVGVVDSNFYMDVHADSGARPTEWECRIMVGPNVVKSQKFGPSPGNLHMLHVWLDLDNLIPPGTGFYIMVDFYEFPFWSKWAYSGDLVMGVKPCEILRPAANSKISPFALISGKGNPKARVDLYEADNAKVRYGTTIVNDDGNWNATPNIAFPAGLFRLVALQRLSYFSDWSNVVGYTVSELEPVPLPVIKTPKNAESFYYSDLVKGTGVPGAAVLLYKQRDGDVIYGMTIVNEQGEWSTSLSGNPPAGPFTITAVQGINWRMSDYSDVIDFTITR